MFIKLTLPVGDSDDVSFPYFVLYRPSERPKPEQSQDYRPWLRSSCARPTGRTRIVITAVCSEVEPQHYSALALYRRSSLVLLQGQDTQETARGLEGENGLHMQGGVTFS